MSKTGDYYKPTQIKFSMDKVVEKEATVSIGRATPAETGRALHEWVGVANEKSTSGGPATTERYVADGYAKAKYPSSKPKKPAVKKFPSKPSDDGPFIGDTQGLLDFGVLGQTLLNTLEFYANPNNWSYVEGEVSVAQADAGNLAKTVLEMIDDECA